MTTPLSRCPGCGHDLTDWANGELDRLDSRRRSDDANNSDLKEWLGDNVPSLPALNDISEGELSVRWQNCADDFASLMARVTRLLKTWRKYPEYKTPLVALKVFVPILEAAASEGRKKRQAKETAS